MKLDDTWINSSTHEDDLAERDKKGQERRIIETDGKTKSVDIRGNEQKGWLRRQVCACRKSIAKFSNVANAERGRKEQISRAKIRKSREVLSTVAHRVTLTFFVAFVALRISIMWLHHFSGFFQSFSISMFHLEG